jgi:hypothetical protein
MSKIELSPKVYLSAFVKWGALGVQESPFMTFRDANPLATYLGVKRQGAFLFSSQKLLKRGCQSPASGSH